MTEKLTEAKEKLLSTEYPPWRNLLSCAILVLLTTGMVSGWWYAYYTASDIECHKGILYFSAVWLAAQWVVIGYLYRYQNIPAFARGAIKLLILLGNVLIKQDSQNRRESARFLLEFMPMKLVGLFRF